MASQVELVCSKGHALAFKGERCSACRRDEYQRDREKNIARAAAWRLANLERVREADRIRAAEDRAKNPEKIAAKKRKWLEENPEFWPAYYAANAEKLRARTAQWKRDNKERVAEHQRRRRELQAGAYGTVTAEEFISQCKKQEQRCYDCGKDGPLTMGHLIPLYVGGTHTADNIVAQCLSCNARQGKRIHRSVKPRG